VRDADNPPVEAPMPPDKTVTDKPVYKLLTEVQKQWGTIRFTANGKKIDWIATLQTEQGAIEITFYPEAAPNHVRNFIALARAGYFDGLRFDGVVLQEGRDESGAVTQLKQVLAGCPLGTGETGCGSIGYWLKPEFNAKANKLTHEEGTVGAVHLQEPDTAGSRFYINLSPAPYLDDNYTIFGKVTGGLDVVRRIAAQPAIVDEGRFEKPTVIKSVTVISREAAR
jgi:cyclophilin family peptidyl-prolyl cis-trans isomerase